MERGIDMKNILSLSVISISREKRRAFCANEKINFNFERHKRVMHSTMNLLYHNPLSGNLIPIF